MKQVVKCLLLVLSVFKQNFVGVWQKLKKIVSISMSVVFDFVRKFWFGKKDFELSRPPQLWCHTMHTHNAHSNFEWAFLNDLDKCNLKFQQWNTLTGSFDQADFIAECPILWLQNVSNFGFQICCTTTISVSCASAMGTNHNSQTKFTSKFHVTPNFNDCDCCWKQ